MLLFKPDYYDCFRCAAGECPDSCCKEWEVEIDDASARFYRTCPNAGRPSREVMRLPTANVHVHHRRTLPHVAQ